MTGITQEKDFENTDCSLTIVSLVYPYQKESKQSLKQQDEKLKNKMKKQNKMFGAMLEEEPTDFYMNDNRSKGTPQDSLNGGGGGTQMHSNIIGAPIQNINEAYSPHIAPK